MRHVRLQSSPGAWKNLRKAKLLAVTALTVWSLALTVAHADDWPQWLGPKRDGVWRETGIIEQFPHGGPKIRWRTPVGEGYSGPAIAGGRVYITDRLLGEGAKNPDNAFDRSKVSGKERVLCLDEATGKVLWTHEYDCHYQVSYPAGPRTTPVVENDRVYTLGTMGDLFCLEATTGKVLWSKNFPRDCQAPIPLWGFCAHPLLDGNKLICLVGAADGLVMAFDKGSGKELWRALSAREPGYCPPMIYDLGGKRQLIIWHPEAVNGLDPETGKLYWSQAFVAKAGLSIPTPRQAGDLLFISAFYDGSMLLKVGAETPQPTIVWKGKVHSELPSKTDNLHSIFATPFLKDGYIYGVCSYGEFRCLKLDTGERLWQTHVPTGGKEERWANAFIIANGDRFFLFNEKGDLLIARLTPERYEEIGRAHILEPTNRMAGRPVLWSHPAFANKCMFARNDKEIVCVSLAAE